jgi:segregation and condensation protein B
MSVNLVSALEAVLFVGGEPMSMDKLCQIFDITPEELNVLAESLEKKLSDSDSGVKLVTLDNAYQLITKTEYADYIKKAFEIKRKTPLSQAGFEVLAVVAYNQPVTRAFIEQVRGVDCSGAIYTLMERGLVEERGRLDLPGKPLLYGTTKNFLRCFSLRDLSDLPPLPKNELQNAYPTDLAEQLNIDGTLTDAEGEDGE